MKKWIKQLIAAMLAVVLSVTLLPVTLAPVTAQADDTSSASHVIINQVYGGKSDGAASHSFIELYNPTDKDEDMSGWSLQYRSSTDNAADNAQWQNHNLTGTIKAKSYYLVRCALINESAGYQVPEGHDSWNITLHNKGIAVALIDGQDTLGTDVSGNILSGSAASKVIDLAACAGNDYGKKKDFTSEDAKAQLPPAWEGDTLDDGKTRGLQSKQIAIRRVNFSDTDNSLEDFEAVDYSGTVEDDKKPHGKEATAPGEGEDGKTDEDKPVANATDKLLISFIYGGKGKDDSPVSDSFVEIYNPNDTEVVLTDKYSLQYSKAGGKSWTVIKLDGKIPAKHSFLVKFESNNRNNPYVWITDFDQTIENTTIDNKGVKFVIMGNQKAIDSSIKNPFTGGTDGKPVDGYIDMFGVPGNDEGLTVDGSEGGTFSWEQGQSKQKGFRRRNYDDTDNNLNDFEMVDFRTDSPALPFSLISGAHSTPDDKISYEGKPLKKAVEIEAITMPTGIELKDLPLPETVTAFYGNGKRVAVPVVWACDAYNRDTPGTYTLTGTLDNAAGTASGDAISKVSMTVELKNPADISGDYEEKNLVLSPDGNLATGMGVAWYSDSMRPYSAVKFWKQGTDENNASVVTGSFEKTEVENTIAHKVLLTGLEADTRYSYRVGDGTVFGEEHSFKTGTDKGEFSFIYTSDAQIKETEDGPVWSSTLDAASTKAPNAAFIAHTGDQVATAQNEVQWNAFLSPVQMTSIPLAPAIGNHDNHATYSRHFQLPKLPANVSGQQGGVYSFINGNALFMVLNTEESLDGQIEWLKTTSAASNAKWKIVMLHRALYSSGESHYQDNLDMRDKLTKVFDELKIDLVLQGHDHSYMRSYPMRNGVKVEETMDGNYSVNPQGTIYLDMAGGANDQSNLAAGALVGDYVRKELNAKENGPMYSVITVKEDELLIESYSTRTSVTDIYGIRKKEAASVVPDDTTTDKDNSSSDNSDNSQDDDFRNDASDSTKPDTSDSTEQDDEQENIAEDTSHTANHEIPSESAAHAQTQSNTADYTSAVHIDAGTVIKNAAGQTVTAAEAYVKATPVAQEQESAKSILGVISNKELKFDDNASINYFDVKLVDANGQPLTFEGSMVITFAYPDGTSAANYTYKVLHLLKSGELDIMEPALSDEGISVRVTELSPFAVVYMAKAEDGTSQHEVVSAATGDKTPVIPVAVILFASMAAITACAVKAGKKKAV